MKKYFVFAALVLAAAVSCTRELATEEVLAPKQGYVQITLSAICDPATKAALDGSSVVWEVGEEVAVFPGSATTPEKFTVKTVEGSAVTITGSVPEGTTTFVAAYPYSKVVSIDGGSVTMNIADQTVSGTQVVDPTALESVAYYESPEATPVFKNVIALASFSVSEEGVTKVTLTPGTGAFGGNVAVAVSAEAAPQVGEGSVASVSITNEAGFTKDATYYVAVAPGAFTGLKAGLAKGGNLAAKESTKEGALTRSKVLPLGEIAAGLEWKLGVITNAAELTEFLANAASYGEDEQVELGNDIDCTGATIGTAEEFNGIFDGKGFSIKNWTSAGAPLFTKITGTIKDFTIDKSCSLTFPAEVNGAVAFVVCNNFGTVSGITNNASITSTVDFKGGRVAVIVGLCDASGLDHGITVENCVNNGEITFNTGANTGGTQYVGTIVGSMGNSKENMLKDCTNNGKLSIICSGTNTKNFYIGGVAGGTTNGSNNINVKNTGAVTFSAASHEAALCLAGITSYTTGAVTDCENTGAITFESEAYLKATFVAGIAGYFASNTMSGSTNRGAVTITAGGIAGRNGIGDIASNVKVGTNLITAGLTIGGLVSATGKNPVFVDSNNHGHVSLTLTKPANADGTHTAARPSMGGLVGDCAGPMTNCNNYGDVDVHVGNGAAFTAKNAGYTLYVGGIVGSSYNFSGVKVVEGVDGTVNNELNKFTLDNCNNSGNVSVYTDNEHTTNHTVAGIVGWPQSEDATAVYVAKNCSNSGNITFEGRAKARVGGIHGGTGRMDGCTNTGKITLVSGQDGSVLGSIAGFHSQAHTFSNCTANGTVEAKVPVTAVAGLVGNLGNVAFTGMDGCSVNCTLIGGPEGNTGLIVGKFNGKTNAITLGSESDPIEVQGSANGNTINAGNVITYFSGATGFEDSMHTVYYSFGGTVYKNDPTKPSFTEDLANMKFTYDGKEYPIIKLADDRYWMGAPLAYVPFGKTPSSNPAEDSGIWYTYTSDGTTVTPNTSNTDAYLYDFATAFGLDSSSEITYGTRAEFQNGTNVGNFRTFEGGQGICPPGWYIPTRSDFLKLVGNSTKDDSVNSDATAIDDPTALYYDADYTASSILKFNAAGWGFSFLGARLKASPTATGSYIKNITTSTNCSVEAFLGNPSVNYVLTSTAYLPNTSGNNVQYFCLQTTFNATYPAGRLTLAYCNYLNAGEIRCVRKAE